MAAAFLRSRHQAGLPWQVYQLNSTFRGSDDMQSAPNKLFFAQSAIHTYLHNLQLLELNRDERNPQTSWNDAQPSFLTYLAVAMLHRVPQIHQLNSTWSESRKAGYVRHAVREYTIHKALRHNNIVSLTDIFEVSSALHVYVSLWLAAAGVSVCHAHTGTPTSCRSQTSSRCADL
jgi:hypothetical protein